MSIKRLAPVLALAATTLAGCGRVMENEAAIVVYRGAIEETVLTPGNQCPCLPQTEIIKYKTYNDTFTISLGENGVNAGADGTQQASQSRRMFLRTKDDKFVDAISVTITYEIRKVPAVTKLYTEFKAVHEDVAQNMLEIRDDIQIALTQPLVSGVRKYDALDLQDQADQLGQDIVSALQAGVNKRLELSANEESPILIRSIVIGGVGFDNETESLLKKKIFAHEQAEIAKAAGAASQIQKESAGQQSQVTGQIVSTLRNSGAPEGQVANLACLDMLRQRLIPDTTNCFGLNMK